MVIRDTVFDDVFTAATENLVKPLGKSESRNFLYQSSVSLWYYCKIGEIFFFLYPYNKCVGPVYSHLVHYIASSGIKNCVRAFSI